MPISTKTIVLEDNFDAVRNAVTGDMLMDVAKAGGFVIEGHAKINASKGGKTHLNVRTGALVNSIEVSEKEKKDTSAEVGVGTNIVYGRIHEVGGIITPVNASKLSWIGKDGTRVFAGSVHIPARPYLRPALDENEDDIVVAVKTELQRNLDEATK